MTRVLLLGAGGNAGINFVKSLKMSGHPYFVVGCDLDSYNLVSSNSDHKVLLPMSATAEKISTILELIQEHAIDFIHAQPDPEVRFLLESANEFKKYIFPHQFSVWEKFSNKLFCQQEWNQKLSLNFKSYPLPQLIREPQRMQELTQSNKKAWIRAIRGAGSKAALPVSNLEQAVSWANYWLQMRGMSQEDFMVAEFLDGREFAVQTLWNRGKLVHSQARERLVYFFGSIMPSGQSSTPAVAKTVNQKNVYSTAEKAVLAIDPAPHGIYCVDLKENHQKQVVPMEVNYGRFFTTSDFFAKIGMNSPHAYVQMHLEGARPEVKIAAAPENLHWIRGLDKEPYLWSPP